MIDNFKMEKHKQTYGVVRMWLSQFKKLQKVKKLCLFASRPPRRSYTLQNQFEKGAEHEKK